MTHASIVHRKKHLVKLKPRKIPTIAHISASVGAYASAMLYSITWLHIYHRMLFGIGNEGVLCILIGGSYGYNRRVFSFTAPPGDRQTRFRSDPRNRREQHCLCYPRTRRTALAA